MGQTYLESLALWDGKSKFDLAKIRQALSDVALSLNQNFIHVAGTNGKGSTSVLIASILNSSEKSVGLNISPHLIDVRERISINGKLIDKNKFYEIVDYISSKLSVKLSYHEFITLMAFYVFRELDYSIIEVGLGGRNDASNIIDNSEITIITSIGLDHCAVLGNTIEKIAYEKAGIIKSGSKLILGKIPEDALKVILEVAKEKNVEYFIFGRDFNLVDNTFGFNGSKITLTPHSFLGKHQDSNLGCAVMAGVLLGVEQDKIIAGISSCKWVGRLEVIENNSVNYLLDAAHNEDGIKSLISFLDSQKMYKTIVFGVLRTKEWQSMIDLLIPSIVHWNIVEPDSEQAVPAEEIFEYLRSKGILSNNYKRDYQKLINDLEIKGDSILVAGSIYLLGAIRKIISPEEIQYF